MREVNFDGLVGPTHNFAGLSPGNVASTQNEGSVSNPRAAALEGLKKMRALRDLGVPQAVLPPNARPDLDALRTLGFEGTDADVIRGAARDAPLALRHASSASSMWAANAATVAPSTDTRDGRLHFVVANLSTMFHRSLEAPATARALRAIFADEQKFAVHRPLPSHETWSDEGAANHTRLSTGTDRIAHVFAWGRSAWDASAPRPSKFPARQTLESARAIARLVGVTRPASFPQQHPQGIDGGAFHTDVLAVGHGNLLLVHALAFLDLDALERDLRATLGDELRVVRASNDELPIADAVAAYPFNSQIVNAEGADGSRAKVIVAPMEAAENPRAKAFLDRVVAEGHVDRVLHLDVRQSMRNGGGPACLRLRVAMTDDERAAIRARVFFDAGLDDALTRWVERRYRDRLAPADLGDPALAEETRVALDELTSILELGSIYPFQR